MQTNDVFFQILLQKSRLQSKPPKICVQNTLSDCSFAPEVEQSQAQVLQLWLFIQMLRRLMDF